MAQLIVNIHCTLHTKNLIIQSKQLREVNQLQNGCFHCSAVVVVLIHCCNVLCHTQDTTGEVVEEEEEEDESIGPWSYVGGLVCIVFLVIVILTYLLSK